jgi:hypothetical protein
VLENIRSPKPCAAHVAYGKAFAKALPTAKSELITEAGHLTQLEQPTKLLRLIESFRGGNSGWQLDCLALLRLPKLL